MKFAVVLANEQSFDHLIDISNHEFARLRCNDLCFEDLIIVAFDLDYILPEDPVESRLLIRFCLLDLFLEPLNEFRQRRIQKVQSFFGVLSIDVALAVVFFVEKGFVSGSQESIEQVEHLHREGIT